MSPPDNPVPHQAIALEQLLAKLEAEEESLSRMRRRLFDRIDLGVDGGHKDRLRAQERELSDERRALHARIDALRAERDALYLQLQLAALADKVEADPPDGEPMPLERAAAP